MGHARHFSQALGQERTAPWGEMKYFTLQWWAAETGDRQPAFQAYYTYLATVKPRLPVALRRLSEDVSLHDGRLRRLLFVAARNELAIDLDGYDFDRVRRSHCAAKIGLAYRGVTSFESLADPEAGLAGPHGYGDLGYDEIEILASGLFQHRMLFSSGIELVVTFAGFTLTYEVASA